MNVPETNLRPLPYHEALATYLRTEEPETWAWFDSAQAQSDHAESLRLDLLKQTYRLAPATYPALFAALDEAREKLGLTAIPATLYQSQLNRELNAALFFLPGEIHIVFEGGVLQLLDARELASVLGHELAHYVLWSGDNRRHLVTDRIAQAMAAATTGDTSHDESARLFRLYTEIYADRGALLVTGDPGPVISGLVKMQTGLSQVDAASYVKQADEVFAKSKARTEQLSHPEAFIRARAISLWAEGAPCVDDEVMRMIEGTTPFDKLDLVAQHRMTALTRRWLKLLLRPAWFQTEPVRAHARMFFEDFEFAPPAHSDEELVAGLRDADNGARDFFCYVLLDFLVADPELEDAPLREAFALAQRLGWNDRLEALVVKELKQKKRDVQKVRAEVEEGGSLADKKETPT